MLRVVQCPSDRYLCTAKQMQSEHEEVSLLQRYQDAALPKLQGRMNKVL